MDRAAIMLRPGRAYRRDLFAAGFQTVGFKVFTTPPNDPGLGDVLMIWNRSRAYETLAQRWERNGATVLVAENGYIQPAREKYFALSKGQHNGCGEIAKGPEPRFPIEMKPWRPDGDHIVLLPQRGIGQHGVAMPNRWTQTARDRLQRMTKRRILIRPHPGNRNPTRSLEQDLEGAWCAVTWGSGAGIKALFAGIPVFHGLPGWIGKWAAYPFDRDIEHPYLRDRSALNRTISWAQWSESEVASGDAFRALLR